MPIEYEIDHGRRLVTAKGIGLLTATDVFTYQREVWSRPDIAGYNELMDMTAVEGIPASSPEGIRELASLAAEMDHQASFARLAIIAPDDLSFGLARMFQSYRNFDDRGTKEVGVFRTSEEAMTFLDAAPDEKD